MDKLREFLGRRVMGVPMIAFVAVGVAILLFLAIRMKPSKPEEDTTEDEPGGDADAFGGENPTFQASPTQSTVMAVPAEDTNELWAGRARSFLTGTLHMSGIAASALVYKYLNSVSLTATERAQMDQVIAVIGYPPDVPDPATDDDSGGDTEPPPDDLGPTTDDGGSDQPPSDAGGGKNTPPTKQGEPPCMHTVQNARDNGPGELARLYFGNNNPETVNKIEAANSDKGNGPWQPGTKIKIPANVQPHYFTATQNTRGLNEIAAKNGVTKDFVKALNPGMDFPVKVGTKVRVR